MSTAVEAFNSYFLFQIWFEAFVSRRWGGERREKTNNRLAPSYFICVRRCPSTQTVMEMRRSVKQNWLLSCIPGIVPVGTSGCCWGPALLLGGRTGRRGAAGPLIPPSWWRGTSYSCTSLSSVLLLPER